MYQTVEINKNIGVYLLCLSWCPVLCETDFKLDKTTGFRVLLGMFLRLRTLLTHINFNYVNKKEAREKVRSSNKKLSERKVYARTLVKNNYATLEISH